MDSDFIIGVGAAPTSQGMFEDVLPLLRPALLYADRVVVYSPSVTMAAAVSQIGQAHVNDLLRIAEALPEAGGANLVELVRAMKAKKRKSKDELVLLMKLNRTLSKAKADLNERMEEFLGEQGGAEDGIHGPHRVRVSGYPPWKPGCWRSTAFKLMGLRTSTLTISYRHGSTA